MPSSRSPPIDRGWAWVVVTSVFLTNTLLVGALKCFGMIFAEMLERYQKSASGTSTMLALTCGISMFIGPLVSVCCELYTCRAVAMAGALTCCFGFLIPAFCDTLEGIVLTFGILTGLGYGLILLPGIVTVGHYFERHRSLANGIIFSGSGFGGIVLPFLLNYTIDSFGVNSALVVLAGLSLQTMVFSSFYRPLRYWTKLSHPVLSTETNQDILQMNHNHKDFVERLNSAPADNQVETAGGKRNEDQLYNSVPNLPGSEKTEPLVLNGVMRFTSVPNVGSDSTLYFSSLDIPSVVPLHERLPAYEMQGQPASNCCTRFLKLLCRKKGPDGSSIRLLEFSLLRDPRFMLFVASSTFLVIIIHIAMVIPAHCRELGMSKTEVATLLSVQGASDMAGRLLTGLIGDRSCVKQRMKLVGLFSILVLSISTFISVWLTTFWSFAAYLVISSVARGSYVAMMPVIVIDLVGSERFSKALGLTSFFQTISVTLGPIIIGALRDLTHSYASGLIFIASCIAVSAVCFILILLIDKRDLRVR